MPVFSLLTFLIFTGQLINSTFQYAMLLYAADPTITVITPAVIVTLGSITYFFSVLEVIVDGFLAQQRCWERENALDVNVLSREGGGD